MSRWHAFCVISWDRADPCSRAEDLPPDQRPRALAYRLSHILAQPHWRRSETPPAESRHVGDQRQADPKQVHASALGDPLAWAAAVAAGVAYLAVLAAIDYRERLTEVTVCTAAR